MFSQLEFKQLRHSIKASVSQMARLLGLQGKGASDKIRAIELGKESAAMPIQRLAKYMQQGVNLGAMDQVLPHFLHCFDVENEIGYEWVFHTRYPRFLALISEDPPDELSSVNIDNIDWLTVVIWIDAPVSDSLSPVKQAAALMAKHMGEDID